jgi:hypothetical protein
MEEIQNGNELKLLAFDKDVVNDDFLGETEPMLW